MKVNSNVSDPPRKASSIDRPEKPYPEFPLSAANCGSWQKKINGRIVYFGKWGRIVNGKLTRIQEDGCWQDALKLYEAQKDDLYAGRRPRIKRAGDSEPACLRMKDLANAFLTAKLRKVSAGELGQRMFQDYRETTDLLVSSFGKDRPVDDLSARDFEELRATLSERWGPVRLGNAITRIKSIFKYALENALTDKPMRYGSEFRGPDKAVLRRHKAKSGSKMFEAAEIRTLLAAAGVSIRAMILLAVNAGYGNHDVGSLPLKALDLEGGWANYPRPKTGINRRCKLWLETVAAIRDVLAVRPEPKAEADKDILFILPTKRRWVRNTEKARTDHLSMAFSELLKSTGLHRENLGFYNLRHSHRTASDAARDPVAADVVMGHADNSMAENYRERIDDSRLVAVSDCVHAWLFGRGVQS